MKKISAILVIFLAFLAPLPVFAETKGDQTLSPYFFVKADKPEGLELLPLKATSAEVDIAGVIADVRVSQVYKNEGTQPLEAIYIFPGSTRAAVYGLKMTIGERVRIAKIKERQEARKKYEKAKAEGKSASLLEQHRPNVFQMNVANIMPGDEIKVELFYTELLVPTDSIYEFVYPTVVGPRYSNQPANTAPASEKWVSNPYLRQGEAPPYTFNLQVSLSSGIPIQELASTTHQVDIFFNNESSAVVELAKQEKLGSNRDYILRYRLKGEKIQSGLMLYEGEEENFFLLMLQPPKRIIPSEIPPREYIYIIDISGSMHGFPLDTSKTLIRELVGSLKPTDTFNILLFAGGSSLWSPQSLPATPANIQRAISHINNQRGGGGTELLPALNRALRLPAAENSARTIVIATDGYVHVEPQAFELIRNNLNNANFFAFGIGSSVNRHLIEGMARAGYGEPFVVTKPAEALQQARRFKQYIEAPLLTNIEINYGDFEAYDVYPSTIPDVFAERPVIVHGKWSGQPEGEIELEGYTGTELHQNSIPVSKSLAAPENQALRYLWARQKITTLSDLGSNEYKEQITQLGLDYNLLTRYTSFIAVDDVVRNKNGQSHKVKQPLPLPQGVSDLAVGGNVPTTPEPETYLLLAVLSILFGWTAYRKGLLVRC